MATGWATPKKENLNFARLCRLLIDGGTRVLRNVFDAIHSPSSLRSTLLSKPVHNILKDLRAKRIVTKQQWDKLYPPSKHTPVTSEDFDITLLFVLIRNVCSLTPPSTGWDKPPVPTDLSREADLARVKYWRNELYAHTPETAVSDSDFEKYWSDISDVLVRLGGPHYQPDIDRLKMEAMDVEDEKYFIKILEEWEQTEQSLMSAIKGIEERLKGELKEIKEKLVLTREPITADFSSKAQGKRPRSSDTTEAGPSGNDTRQSDSEKLKEAIKVSTQNQPKFLEGHDVTSAKTDEIFTQLTVYYADKKLEKKEQLGNERSRKENLMKYTKRETGYVVTKFEDIFIPMAKDKSRENPEILLLTGKPGIGKTMFCEKVIRDWSVNRLFQNEGTPNIKFAYLLKFRQLNSLGDKELTLRELLNCSSLLDDNSVIDDSLFEYLTKNPSEVMIILDGFDEHSKKDQIASDFEKRYPNDSRAKMPIPALCSKLIRGKVLRNSVVLVSSRPGEAEELEEISVDRYVEISGFSPEQVTEYVDKYFSEPEKEQTKNTVRQHIEKNENLVSFCHIPLLSFLLCWCLEWRITQSGITKILPAKITELYDEVVEVGVQKLHAHLKYLKMSGNTRKIAQETMDKLAKLAAYLQKHRKFVFDQEDMEKQNFTGNEIENLKVSGILHCVPGIRISAFKTKTEFSFLHLTLLEYFSALFFVKSKEIPDKQQVSGQTFVFMSGCLSKEKDGEQMEKLIQQVTPEYEDEDVNKLLTLQCLYEYRDDELTKRTINNLYDKYCDSYGVISFEGVTDVDTKGVSYLVDIIHSLKEQHPQPHYCYSLDIGLSSLTSFGVGVVCDSLVRNSFITELLLYDCSLDDNCIDKITNSLVNTGITFLNLQINNITDVGVYSICSVIIQDDCHVEELYLSGNNKITEECKKHVKQLVQEHKPGVRLYI